MKALINKDFPDELHKEAKVRAAQKEITLKEFVIRAIEVYLKKKGGKG